MSQRGLLIVFSGPSGAGKGTICKELLKRNPHFCVSVSATTRKPRPGEIDGINYFFIDKQNFESMINDDEFLEHALVHGNYYGTPKKYVMEKLNDDKDVILEIDIQGALQIKEKYPDGVFVFILPPSMEELRNRIEKRATESKEDILKRFNTAYEELKYAFKYDYAVVNDEVLTAVEKIEAIIKAEKCRVSRQKELIKSIEEV